MVLTDRPGERTRGIDRVGTIETCTVAVDRRQQSVRHRARGSLRAPLESAAAAASLLYGLGVLLALIGLYVFADLILALIGWARSPEPWWRP
ncbi:MAG TPA: hypothetical protein VIS07_03245 [Candidatus Binatia bacterium]